jgi:hypothetical protein
MSRLDDELRKAFRREQPSADFSQRLLERVALQPPPKARWWQRLATLLEPPKLRWVAIGVTASLLLAIGAAQYQRLNRVVVEDNGQHASALEPNVTTPGNADSVDKQAGPDRPDSVADTKSPATTDKRIGQSAARHRSLMASTQKAEELKAEGEAAKEKVMMALAIASSVLSDAQKAVREDGLNP